MESKHGSLLHSKNMTRKLLSTLWFRLAVSAISLSIHAQAAPAKLTVQPGRPLQANFRGLGFNHGVPDVDDETWNSVFVKRLKEINPQGFSRIFCGLTGWAPTPEKRDWETPEFKNLCRLLTLLKDVDHDVYLTMVFWGKRPDWMPAKGPIDDPEILHQWADAQTDLLEELVVNRGFTNIKYWCMTNELQTGVEHEGFDKIKVEEKDGKKEYIPVNMPLFGVHHRAVFDELKKRGLEKKVLLLATDALGMVGSWRGTLPWAVSNMDDITGIYGVHDYPHGGGGSFSHPDTGVWTTFADERQEDWADPKHYHNALLRYRYAAGMTAKTGKGFVLGEFGGITEVTKLPNGQRDAMRASETPVLGINLCERTLAGMNAGFSAMAKWHFNDFKNTYGNGWTVEYNHGTMKGADQGWALRPEFHAYGLLTRYIRKDSSTYAVTSDDASGLLRTIAVKNNKTGKVTAVVINRHPAAAAIQLDLKGLAKPDEVFAKLQFDPERVPAATQTTLHGPIRRITPTAEGLTDEIPAGAMALYTDDIDSSVAAVEPPPIRSLAAEMKAAKGPPAKVTKEGEVLLNLDCAKVDAFSVRMKGNQKINEQGKMPQPWSSNSWDEPSTVEFALETEPTTSAKAISLRNIEGKAALQFYTWNKVTLAEGRQYTVAFDYLAGNTSNGKFNFNGIDPKVESIALSPTDGQWKRCQTVINIKEDTSFSPQFMNLKTGTENPLWLKYFSVTDTGVAK
jgi:hypothetical protein